jgi:hypothetical protein
MNKLQEIKNKAKELFELIDEYETESFNTGVQRGIQKVYDRTCNAFVEEMEKQGDLTDKSVQDIPSAERILNASSVIRELFPDLNT